MFKILIPEDVAESGKEYLKERGYELKVGVPTDVENLKRRFGMQMEFWCGMRYIRRKYWQQEKS